MIRFQNPHILYLLLLLIPTMIYVFWQIRRARSEVKRFGDTDLVKELMPDLSLRRRLVKDIVLAVALAFIVIALARPQVGSKSETVEREGVEMMICLDISNSMLSEDVKPSRLARAKAIVSRIMNEMDNNKIGLVYFAGDAFIQLPLTTDVVSAKMFLDNADPGMIGSQGTALAEAVNLASRCFTSDEGVGRAIVLITDAEDHDGDLTRAVKAARENGIVTHVIGVGSVEGGPIPLKEGGYLMDNNGEMVVTKLNEEIARQVVSTSGGVYIRANDVSQTTRLLQQAISEMEQSSTDVTVYGAYHELYHIPLICALLLLLFDCLYLDRKNRRLREIRLFD